MSGLFGGAPKAQPTIRMPDQKDPAALAAQSDARRRQLAAGGRDSTNLTGGANTFTNDKLGQ